MRNVCLRALVLALSIFGLLGTMETKSQTVLNLLDITNSVWKYDQSGADLGTAWTNITYADQAWPSGKGLFGFDNGPAYPLPTVTAFNLSDTLVTYYLRTTFSFPGIFPGATNGVSLISSNYIDDGAIIYLNGFALPRVRMPTTAINSTTRSTGGNTEGAFDVITISPALLRPQNIMAVELHQGAVPATDITWGMKLIAIVPTQLTITNQPVGDTISVGDTITLTAGVSGGPVFYQWRKDGVNISNGGNVSGANTNALRIVNAQLNNAGTYTLVVSNAVTTFLQSSPAVLNVVDDTTGPTLISAVIRDTGATNQIVIQFSETVQSGLGANSTSTNLANYRITQCGTANTVTITNATQGGSQVQLRVSGANWNPTNCYYLTVNIVADSRGNQINPNSVIPISLPITTNLTQMSDFWDFMDCVDAEFCLGPGNAIYTDQQWYRTNYVAPSSYWGNGPGVFVRDADPMNPFVVCAGDSRGQGINFQFEPILFRRTFKLPPTAPSNGTFRLRYVIDDGMVLYLNGKQVLTVNVPAGPVLATTRATTSIGDATCVTNVSLVVDNLLPGTNWLAVALCQGPVENPPQNDVVFGFEMDLISNQVGIAPTNPPAPYQPRFVLSRTNKTNYVISWPATNYGLALRYSTNMTGYTPAQVHNWWTNDLNWTQVKDQSNPYSNAIPSSPGPRRFYQLYRDPR